MVTNTRNVHRKREENATPLFWTPVNDHDKVFTVSCGNNRNVNII